MKKEAKISEIIAEAIVRQGGNKSEIGRKIGVSSQLLGQYEKGQKEPKIGFFARWRKEYGEDLCREIETKVFNLPQKEGENVDAAEIKSNLKSIKLDLNMVLDQQTIARAEVRAFGQYQVSKDAMGDQGEIVRIMAQIGTLIGANLKASDREDKKTAKSK